MNSTFIKLAGVIGVVAVLSACGEKPPVVNGDRARNAAACSLHYGAIAMIQLEDGDSKGTVNLKRFTQLSDQWQGNTDYDNAIKYLDSQISAMVDESAERAGEALAKMNKACILLGLPVADI